MPNRIFSHGKNETNQIGFKGSSMTTWISSDWHIGHDNIRRFSNRPFASLEEMEASCVAECQAKLRPGDRFIYLGDLHWAKNPHPIDSFLQKILTPQVQFFFVRGNHDYQIDKVRKLADEHGKYKITLIKEIFEFQYGDNFIVCSHYPLLSWNKDKYGSYMFHGHTHGRIQDLNKGMKRVDIEYDTTKSWLVSIDDAIKLANNV